MNILFNYLLFDYLFKIFYKLFLLKVKLLKSFLIL
jgi:hypothetical protein